MVEFKEYFKKYLTGNGYKEHKDGFNSENIARTNLNNSFFISYSVQNVANGITVEDNINVVVQLFHKGFKTPQDAIDEAMEKANGLRLNVCSFENVETFNVEQGNDSTILGVDFVSQTPEPLNASNDNSIIIEMIFNVRFLQIIC